jgi:hypothetical protein
VWWWLAILVPLWLTLMLCCAWEPVVRDSWGHLHWHRTNEMSWQLIYDFAEGTYVHNNPRLGQVMTFLAMTPGPYHAIFTPLVELAMFVFATMLVLGRRPRATSGDDAYAFLVVTALVAACSPVIGQMLFYRPFAGNYLFGLVLDLAWLLPYRLHGEAQRAGRRWWVETLGALGLLVLGFAAGECNEHTGPAVALLAIVFVVPGVRARRRVRAWMIAGLLGLAAGWLALVMAPGQDIRYNGLAHEAGPLGRIVDRGALRDLVLVAKAYLHPLFALAWLLIALVAWRARTVTAKRAAWLSAATRLALVGLAAASLVVAVTLLGSPKDGERLYFAADVLAATAIAGWVLALVRTGRPRVACAVLSALALALGAERCLETYYVVGDEGRERVEILSNAAPGATPTVPRYSRPHSWWFIGEDFDDDDPTRRHITAHDYGLADIQLSP